MNTKRIDYTPDPEEAGINYNKPKPNMYVGEGAPYMCISERNLRGLIAEGQIPAARVGRRVILRRVDLDAFLKSKLV